MYLMVPPFLSVIDGFPQVPVPSVLNNCALTSVTVPLISMCSLCGSVVNRRIELNGKAGKKATRDRSREGTS